MKSLIQVFIIFTLNLAACKSTKPSQSSAGKAATLTGRWELVSIPASPENINKLYGARKPYLVFDDTLKRFSGHTSCNSLSGPLNVTGKSISFREPMMMTKMACLDGMEGENAFILALKEVNSYIIKESSLSLLHDERLLMQFVRKRE